MTSPVERLDLAAIGRLTCEAPDPQRFPALALARAALCAGGTAPITLNAANEEAASAFLAGRLGFIGICEIVERTLAEHPAEALRLEERRVGKECVSTCGAMGRQYHNKKKRK